MACKNGNEGCVRILLSAGARAGVKNKSGMSSLDYALEKFESDSTEKYKRIVQLLRGKTVSLPRVTETIRSKLDEFMKAAVEGSLAQFLDSQDVPHSFMP